MRKIVILVMMSLISFSFFAKEKVDIDVSIPTNHTSLIYHNETKDWESLDFYVKGMSIGARVSSYSFVDTTFFELNPVILGGLDFYWVSNKKDAYEYVYNADRTFYGEAIVKSGFGMGLKFGFGLDLVLKTSDYFNISLLPFINVGGIFLNNNVSVNAADSSSYVLTSGDLKNKYLFIEFGAFPRIEAGVKNIKVVAGYEFAFRPTLKFSEITLESGNFKYKDDDSTNFSYFYHGLRFGVSIKI